MATEPQPEVSATDINAVAALQHAIFLHLTDVGEDRDAFFAWMGSILKELGLFDKDGKDYERFAYWFARQFWNAIPLESNGFRPLPLPPPKSGAPCPCGSGSTFRDCCEPWVPLDELPENVLWPALVQSRPHEYWIDASRGRPSAAGGNRACGRLLLRRRPLGGPGGPGRAMFRARLLGRRGARRRHSPALRCLRRAGGFAATEGGTAAQASTGSGRAGPLCREPAAGVVAARPGRPRRCLAGHRSRRARPARGAHDGNDRTDHAVCGAAFRQGQRTCRLLA